MSLFFFHLRSPAGLEPDEIGFECPTLDEAYLEACRAVPDMAADLVRKGLSPMDHGFEIAGADGGVLLDVPFTEVLRTLRKPVRPVAPGPVTGAKQTRPARSEGAP